jgi:hypothetical protein
LESLYRPDVEGMYHVRLEDLQKMCTSFEREHVMAVLDARAGQPINQNDAMTDRLETLKLQVQIVKYLIDCCKAGDSVAGSGHEEVSGSEFEDEAESDVVAKSKQTNRKKRDDKGKGKGIGNILIHWSGTYS